jgi:hypothetical protein
LVTVVVLADGTALAVVEAEADEGDVRTVLAGPGSGVLAGCAAVQAVASRPTAAVASSAARERRRVDGSSEQVIDLH